MLLFVVPILVRSRIARGAAGTRTPSSTPRRSSSSQRSGWSDRLGGRLIGLVLVILLACVAVAAVATTSTG
jgi:hypothetical protein